MGTLCVDAGALSTKTDMKNANRHLHSDKKRHLFLALFLLSVM
jgi:hypothetical protein